MKKARLTIFLTALLMLMGLGVTHAQQSLFCALTFPDENSANNKVSTYTSTWTATIGSTSWSITNFNNNQWNNSWTYIKAGRKNNASIANIATANALSAPIAQVTVTVDAVTAAKINSTSLVIASDADFTTDVVTIDGPAVAKGTMDYVISNPTANRYYKLIYDCASGSSNGLITISKVEYFAPETVATPTFSPEAGTYTETQYVSISCATSGASIYYTTDGSTPTSSSNVYSTPIEVAATTTIKAMATKTGMVNSAVAEATYSIQLEDFTFNKIYAHTAVTDAGTYMIVDVASGRALTWANGTSSSPTAVAVTIENDQIVANDSKLFWNVKSEADGYVITPAGDDTKWLYTTNSNTGVRIGTNNAKYWTLDITDSGNSNYHGFKHNNTNRYLGVYNSQDWRTYTSIHNNIKNSQIELFILGDAPVQPGVAAPTFTPAGGTYLTEQMVVISSSTEGATIFYTTDGTEPTTSSTLYETPIAVNETTTIKAFAVKDAYLDSPVVTANYDFRDLITVAEARTLQDNEYAAVEAIVTFMDGRNIYAQDATAGIDLYLNANTIPQALTLGDKVRAYGKKTVYNGLVELTGINGSSASDFVIVSSGNELPVVQKSIAEINSDFEEGNLLQSTRVKIINATMGEINTSGNTYIYQNDNTLNVYRIPTVEGMLEGDLVTITGVVGCYNAPQLRVASVADVEFMHTPFITANPLTINGFNYSEGQGPSEERSFVLSARDLIRPVTIIGTEHYEISTTSGDAFNGQDILVVEPTDNQIIDVTIYVRLKAGLSVGSYSNEAIMLVSSGAPFVNITCSGSVTGSGQGVAGYVRINDVAQLTEGSQVIIAARFDENANSYYAMPCIASGKPDGVLFTSTISGEYELISSDIEEEEATYYWTIANAEDGAFTFTNANGDMLGYSSSTNFSNGGNNTAWVVNFGTSDTAAMVPSYNGYTIINHNQSGRAVALNSTYKFGAYATSNMNNGNAPTYNFFMDLFVKSEGGTPIVATPTFSPAAGTYYEAQEVSISCATAEAEIFYSLDSENGPWIAYTEAITVDEDMTIWAYATKEGYDDSHVASATYIIQDDIVVIFNQDWEGDWNGWTQVSVEGDGAVWNIASYSGNHYAYINAYNQGQNEDWLISPAFDLNAYENVVLSFKTAKNYTGADIEVFFSNDYDGQDPTTATWQTINCELSQGSWTWTESGAISLDGLDGSNCYIAFKYTATETEAAGWEIDDIMLTSGADSNAVLTASPNAISNLTYVYEEGPSNAVTYQLSANNLEGEGEVLVLVTEGFEISLDDETYGEELEIAYADGSLVDGPVTVYVRLIEGLEVGTYEGVIMHEGGEAYTEVSLAGTVTSADAPMIDAFMPLYVQGNNGTNNNRVPVAIAVYIENLEPNTTYRYTNQFVDGNDGATVAGAGNVIYANENGFYRTTSPSLSNEGGYGEFTTDETGEAFAWFINEPTANTRFTPGNQVYLRIRVNDGHDGTDVAYIFTTEDYATVLNFGTENDANQGTAFYAKSEESPMTFAMMFANDTDFRPTYSTPIETTGVDYGSINQYANFYKDEVASKDGYFGGILPNVNDEGINIIWILDMESYVINDFYAEGGEWGTTQTANPQGGLNDIIFIDLTGDSVNENMDDANLNIWNKDHEIVIENMDDINYDMVVFNVMGQAVMSKNIAGISSQSISHNLRAGLYLVTMQSKAATITKKIIVR